MRRAAARRHAGNSRRRASEMELNRVVAFTDAVVAIAITLLVLDLNVPAGLGQAALGDALTGLGPELFSYLLSFLVIGRFWITHHRVFRHVRYVDDRLLAYNGLFLLSIAFLPFPTGVLGEYMHHPAALVLYAASVGLAGLLLALLWVHIAYTGHLVDDGLDPRLRRYLLLRFLSIPAVFVTSMPLALAGQLRLTAAMWLVLPPVARGVLRRLYRRGAS